MRGTLGRKAFSESIPQIARSSPAKPPKAPSKALSTSSCLTICQRPAPSAARMPISLLRDSERASSRFATLTQATSRTQPAIAHNISKAECALPTIALSSGKTFAPCLISNRDIADASPRQWCRCSPAPVESKRPVLTARCTERKSLSRCSVIGVEPSLVSRKSDIEVQSSGGTEVIGKVNRGGITPIT